MSYFRKGVIACLLCASMVAAAGTASTNPAANLATVRVLHSFTGNTGTADGYAPFAALLEDGRGELYGTTQFGGTGNCIGGCGTVFKVAADGTETVLYSFTGGSDGALPNAGLIRGRDGNLYGTTEIGGGGAGCQSAAFVQAYGLPGCGTVFSISPAGQLKIVYAFTGVNGDGSLLFSGVVQDERGNLFGTTAGGGSKGAGTIFEISPNSKERVLYSFSGGADGSGPNSVTIGRDGALYGTTIGGGASGVGTVFKLERNGTEEVLHSFGDDPTDGASPGSGLLLGLNGRFYGSTLFGGAQGLGGLFEVTPAGELRMVYSFTTGAGGSAAPNGPLVQDAAGDIYGTTEFGGTAGLGSIFRLSRHNVFTTLVSLDGSSSGASSPAAGIVLGKDGNLYGTSVNGGTDDGGTVFEVSLARKHHSRGFEDRDHRWEHSYWDRTDRHDGD